MRVRLFLAVLSSLAMVGGVMSEVDGAAAPSLKLIGTKQRVSFTRTHKRQSVPFNMFGVQLTGVGGAFDLRANRAGYDDPIDVVQVDPNDPTVVVRDLRDDLVRDWFYLRGFLKITVRDRDGDLVRTKRADVCPNQGPWHRVADTGPAQPTYPSVCRANPFTLGSVIGLDEGWAVDPARGGSVRLKDGRYRVRIAIAPTFRDLLDIPDRDSQTTLTLTVRTSPRGGAKAPAEAAATPSAQPPVDATPDLDTLPDLRALPAWAIHVRETATTDELAFNATEWNAGPAPLVVEGIRIPDTETMQAHQYFYDADGTPVGQDDDVGQLQFHHGDGHDHWHFLQFVTYELVAGHTPDGSGPLVATSGKQAWCLVPTEAIDLTVERAAWRPHDTNLSTACGSEGSQTIREVLHVGHGDTYNQTVSGQTFDITSVPAGAYQVRIEVNPELVFHEADMANNVSFRNITIGGDPGEQRTVTVEPVGNVTA